MRFKNPQQKIKNEMKFLLFLLFPVLIFSQNTMRGIISDENGHPVENVLVKNISKSLYHTHTDISGNFSLENVNLQDSLEFVHQDFEPQKIVLKNLENLNIILEKKSFQIKEITITKNLKN
ncbi:hypothetical protein B2I21_29225, partial [Chryseobacterium mucoviscidosis]